jgi:hypothetical protein
LCLRPASHTRSMPRMWNDPAEKQIDFKLRTSGISYIFCNGIAIR